MSRKQLNKSAECNPCILSELDGKNQIFRISLCSMSGEENVPKFDAPYGAIII